MMRAFRLASLGMAAMLASLPLAPAHGQATGLLGDSQVSQGRGSDAKQDEPAPRRRARPQRVVDVSPYLQVDQSAIWDLKGGNGDVLTYTTVAAGVSATIQTNALAVGADVRIERQFSWNQGETDQTILSGLVAARADVVPNLLSIEGGAIATRARSDGFTGANNSLLGGSTSNVYSTYLGPTLTAPLGELTVNGAYRLGYNRIDNDDGSAVALGLPVTGTFDESWVHNLSGSVGMQPGVLPVGWSVGAGWLRETASQLDQRYDQKFVRADLTFPVAPTIALLGGVGYEKIEISNRDAVRDVDGLPVRDSRGRFLTDQTAPRRLSYDDSGFIWDVGVMWRPGPHLSAEVHVGHRYGSMSYTGNLSWQPSRRTTVSVILFDNIDSFGRAMNSSLANLGTDFYVGRNPFSGDINGCAFASGGGTGACFTDTLTGISAANYRSRGVFAQFVRQSNDWTVSLAGGYSNRKFISDSRSVLASANGLADQNYYATFGLARSLDAVSSIDVTTYLNYFDSGLATVGNATQMGGYVSYGRTITRRLEASAAVGIDSIDREGQQALASLLAQIGLRYSF
jgi:hypothetical protein